MNKQTSLTDIARVANVSVATVSYALNNRPEVSEKTRQRIKEIANQMNYHPNKAAQGLRTHQSRLIGMLINTFNSMFNGELVDDIRETLDHYGYSLVVIGNSNADLIDSQLFDALIIFNYTTTKSNLTALIERTKIPIVLMANELDFANVDNIVIDNQSAITNLLKQYEKSQHQNICFFRGSRNSYNSAKRFASCRAYFEKYHPEYDVAAHTFNGHLESAPTYPIAKKLLSEKKYNFFFCLNDMMAYGVYRAASELHLKVGVDFSITGFDNAPKSGEIYLPKLTTADSQLNTWSQEVAKSLVSRLEHPETPAQKTILVPTKIVQGASILYK
ncbi:LacI family DNA-binding transcriptional regulator [Levilactobacillus fujinensis]|uniref:LacI family DNA-binding transcriptional regulator n=1 Tax=Levilactobacillus fujinensis TaxID=2486024 RepID=A0ABW1THR6_9LACO|nr:LacI family DNA-binding transcriptional regulator [Levilactobacillus fujinensis]